MKIEGMPEGYDIYDIVRIGRPEKGELFICGTGLVARATGFEDALCYIIFRKIERPKQYRPFKDAEEFKPHRDKWWRYKENHGRTLNRNIRPPVMYNDDCYGERTWLQRFGECEFEDGSPFGVEVSE
jgi:hypothetical protein